MFLPPDAVLSDCCRDDAGRPLRGSCRIREVVTPSQTYIGPDDCATSSWKADVKSTECDGAPCLGEEWRRCVDDTTRVGPACNDPAQILL